MALVFVSFNAHEQDIYAILMELMLSDGFDPVSLMRSVADQIVQAQRL